MSDSHYREEPRFYPDYRLNADFDKWRELPQSERTRRAYEFNAIIQLHLFRRIEQAHPDWNERQHKLMFFKLRYAGEHFDVFSHAQIERGLITAEELEPVAKASIPTEPAEKIKYL